MKTMLGFAVVALLAGCKVAATAEDYRWSVTAPKQAALHSQLHFTVSAKASDGHPVAEVPYMWVAEWVGVHGIRHQGWTSREERIRVKGDPGPAYVRILAFSRDHELVEVARATFEVTAEPPPAR